MPGLRSPPSATSPGAPAPDGSADVAIPASTRNATRVAASGPVAVRVIQGRSDRLSVIDLRVHCPGREFSHRPLSRARSTLSEISVARTTGAVRKPGAAPHQRLALLQGLPAAPEGGRFKGKG